MKTVRKNITLSSELAEWFEDKSKKLGVSQSALMVMALGDYVKQDKALNIMDIMPGLMAQLKSERALENNEDGL